MMKLFNVRFQLKSVQTNALKKAGQRGSRKLLPALQRAPNVAPDSSDEEAERLVLRSLEELADPLHLLWASEAHALRVV